MKTMNETFVLKGCPRAGLALPMSYWLPREMAVWGQLKVVDKKEKRMQRQRGMKHRKMERKWKRERKYKISLSFFTQFLENGNTSAVSTTTGKDHSKSPLKVI